MGKPALVGPAFICVTGLNEIVFDVYVAFYRF